MLHYTVLCGALVVCGAPMSAVMAQSYRVIDLGSFDLGARTPAVVGDLDESGRVVGRAPGFPNDRAFLWELGRMTDLGSVIAEEESGATAINALGIVVGWSAVAHTRHAAAWTGSQVIDLHVFEGLNSEALAINRSHWIVGWGQNAEGLERGFVYRNSNMIDIGTLPGGSQSRAEAIDSFGRVAGTARNANGDYNAIIWENGLMASLGVLPGARDSHAVAMNDRDQVVGSSDSRAFLFEGDFLGGTMTELPSLGGSRSFAWDINSAGVIVGAADPPSGGLRGSMWVEGQSQDLNDLIPPWSGWHVTLARRINESGYIAGQATLDGQERGVLLIPTPMHLEPPVPGRAGQVNTFVATGATPGATVRLLYGDQRGFSHPPGCPAAIVEMATPFVGAATTADQDGRVTLELFVPGFARGRTFVLQMVETGGCHLSQPAICTFR